MDEKSDVCQAIQTLNQRAADERQIEVLLQSIKNLMETMGWTADQTMNNMKVSDSDRQAISARLQS